MAPEEFARGSTIDGRTNVYTLGRLAHVLLGDHGGNESAWCGPPEALDVVRRATHPNRDARIGSVSQFVDELRQALRAG
jgi:serine/threonine-protein kinase